MSRSSSDGAPEDQPRGAQMAGAGDDRTARARAEFRRGAPERIAETRRRRLAAKRLPPLPNGVVDPTYPQCPRRVQASPEPYCTHPDATVGLGRQEMLALGREGRSCPKCPPGMWQVPFNLGWDDQ